MNRGITYHTLNDSVPMSSDKIYTPLDSIIQENKWLAQIQWYIHEDFRNCAFWLHDIPITLPWTTLVERFKRIIYADTITLIVGDYSCELKSPSLWQLMVVVHHTGREKGIHRLFRGFYYIHSKERETIEVLLGPIYEKKVNI